MYVTRGRNRRTHVPILPHFAASIRLGSGSVRPGGAPDDQLGAVGRGARSAAASRCAAIPRAFWIALWLLAAVAEVLALRPVLFDRDAPIDGLDVVFSLVGGSFAAFGLVAWRRRPDSRSGMLMTATGFAFFVSPLLGQLDAPLAVTTRTLLVDWWIFSFVALLLTLLTSGRLQSRRSTAGSSRPTRFPLVAPARSPGCCSLAGGREPPARVPRRGRRARRSTAPSADSLALRLRASPSR